jgi:DNA-directed RNA polymerase specialized sigma24 family protein
VDGQYAERLTSEPEQEGWSISADLRYALAQLPPHQREAVILVGAQGLTMEEAAAACGCEVGTIKSRTHRGRARLAELLADTRSNADESEQENAKALVAAAGASLGAEAAVAAVFH